MKIRPRTVKPKILIDGKTHLVPHFPEAEKKARLIYDDKDNSRHLVTSEGKKKAPDKGPGTIMRNRINKKG